MDKQRVYSNTFMSDIGPQRCMSVERVRYLILIINKVHDEVRVLYACERGEKKRQVDHSVSLFD